MAILREMELAAAVLAEVDPDWDSHEFERVERLRDAARKLALLIQQQATPDDGHEHDFIDECWICGLSAHEHFNRKESA